MIWSGTVFRNSEFGKTGMIDVMLYQKYIPNGTARFWAQPFYKIGNMVKKALGIETSTFGGSAITCQCLVLSSGLGAEDNCGIFSVPQVGTKGLVIEVGDNERFSNSFYVWLGGLYGNKQFGESVKIPRDDTDDDIGEEDEALISNKENDTITGSDYITKGNYIIKTKTNNIENYDDIDQEKTNFENILPENTFILNKEKSCLKHNLIQENKVIGFEKLLLSDNEATLIRKLKKDDKILEQKLIMNDSETTLVLKNEDGDVENTITFNPSGGAEIKTTGEMSITSKENFSIKSEKDINIESEGKINLKSKDMMSLHGKQKNIAELLDKLAETVKTLKTQGSPAAQSVQPDVIMNAQQIQMDIAQNFDKG